MLPYTSKHPFKSILRGVTARQMHPPEGLAGGWPSELKTIRKHKETSQILFLPFPTSSV